MRARIGVVILSVAVMALLMGSANGPVDGAPAGTTVYLPYVTVRPDVYPADMSTYYDLGPYATFYVLGDVVNDSKVTIYQPVMQVTLFDSTGAIVGFGLNGTVPDSIPSGSRRPFVFTWGPDSWGYGKWASIQVTVARYSSLPPPNQCTYTHDFLFSASTPSSQSDPYYSIFNVFVTYVGSAQLISDPQLLVAAYDVRGTVVFAESSVYSPGQRIQPGQTFKVGVFVAPAQAAKIAAWWAQGSALVSCPYSSRTSTL